MSLIVLADTYSDWLAVATTQRNPTTTNSPSKAELSCPMTSKDIRSSSWAQTAERQATVTTPDRSETALASRATVSPTARGQTPCTAARHVFGANFAVKASSASEAGRGERRLMLQAKWFG